MWKVYLMCYFVDVLSYFSDRIESIIKLLLKVKVVNKLLLKVKVVMDQRKLRRASMQYFEDRNSEVC